MGEKYLNAIDRPVPGLITHADSGLHIDHNPRFLQTPLWAASGLPPTNLARAECMEGDLRRPGGGMRLVARGAPRKDSSPPRVLPFLPNTGRGFCSQAGRSRLVSLQPSPRCANTGEHSHALTEPSSCCILFQDKKSSDPRAAVSHRALREYKLIKRFPALSQGPESPSQA